MASWVDRVEAYCRATYGMTDDWRAFKFQGLDPYDKSPGTLVTGAVTPLKKAGKYKGWPDWKKRDRTTERVFLVPTGFDAPTPPAQGGE